MELSGGYREGRGPDGGAIFVALFVHITDNEVCDLNVTYEVAIHSSEAEYYKLHYIENRVRYESEDIITNEGYVDGSTYFFKRMVNGQQFGKPTSTSKDIEAA